MSYSYQGEYREGVAFVFYRDGKVLIEHRLNQRGKKETFFPSGSIEIKDHISGQDYREITLLREISEEFVNQVKPLKYEYFGDIKVEEVKIIFYLYLITNWEGSIPNYITESNEKPAPLEWISLHEYKNFFEFESAKQICEKLIIDFDF